MVALRKQILTHNWQWKQRTAHRAKVEEEFGGTGWCETTLPTEVFKDLLHAGRIKDPFVGTNEDEVQWVGESDWLYKTQFDLYQPLQDEQETVVLVFYGLDTYATVFLNGQEILKSEVPSVSMESELIRICFMNIEWM
jgi:beta-mannosidase